MYDYVLTEPTMKLYDFECAYPEGLVNGRVEPLLRDQHRPVRSYNLAFRRSQAVKQSEARESLQWDRESHAPADRWDFSESMGLKGSSAHHHIGGSIANTM